MKLPRLVTTVAALALATAAGFSAARTSQGMAAPTEAHKWLQSHVGTWDAKGSAEMMGEFEGTWEVESGPGGLWIVSEFKADMMGMPFHGMEFMGYDPETKHFTSIWIDSMNNTSQTMVGTYDKAGKTLTSKGEMAGMDGAMVEATHVTRYPDADHMTFEMLLPGPGGEPVTGMKIEYTRRK